MIFKKLIFSKIEKEIYERERVFLSILLSPFLGISPFIPFSLFTEIAPYLMHEIKDKNFLISDDVMGEVLGFFEIS